MFNYVHYSNSVLWLKTQQPNELQQDQHCALLTSNEAGLALVPATLHQTVDLNT